MTTSSPTDDNGTDAVQQFINKKGFPEKYPRKQTEGPGMDYSNCAFPKPKPKKKRKK